VCDGCETPVCLVLHSVKAVTGVEENDRMLQGPANGTDSDYATWRGGGGVQSQRGVGCPAATPTRITSWGAVKSLYR